MSEDDALLPLYQIEERQHNLGEGVHNLLQTLLHEYNTHSYSIFVIALITATTDSALIWALNDKSVTIIAKWLDINKKNIASIQIPIKVASVIMISSLDLYAARGMAEKIQRLAKRRKIFPKHTSIVCSKLAIFLVFNCLAIFGPAGLIFDNYSSDMALAIYLAIAIGVTNILSGTFFMHEFNGFLQRSMRGRELERRIGENKVIHFIDSLTLTLSELDGAQYIAVFTTMTDELSRKKYAQSISILYKNGLYSRNIGPNRDRVISKSLMFVGMTLSLAISIPLAWLHYVVGRGNIPRLINGADTGNLRIFSELCSICYALMYGAVGTASGVSLFTNVLSKSPKNCSIGEMCSGLFIFIIAAIASLTTVSLTHDNFNGTHGVKIAMYGATYFAMLFVNINALGHISPKLLIANLKYDIKQIYLSCKKYSKRHDGRDAVFMDQRYLKVKAADLRRNVLEAPTSDVQYLEKVVTEIIKQRSFKV